MEMGEEQTSPKQSTELLLARVVHVIDPSNFWIQIGTKEVFDQFSDLEEQLQSFCEETGTLTSGDGGGMEDGDFIAARSNLQKVSAWRRAQIARQNIDKGTADVWYLDYGTTEIVSLDQICSAVPAFFFIVDTQAWKCGLAGIKPIAKTWTSRAAKYFQKLTSDTLLQASAVSYQAMFGCLQIALYTDEGKDGHSLAHKMLEEEIGMACDIELVAEYAGDVEQVVPQTYQEHVLEEPQNDADEDRWSETDEKASHDEVDREDVDETRPEHVSDLEEGETTPEPASPGGVIPSFNLNSIFKTKMASADLIEQKKEDARKKAVTTEMAKDLEMVQKDMAESVIPDAEITEWGASDYDIGQRTGNTQTDVCSLKMAEFREAIGNTEWSPSMTEGLAKQKPLLQELKVADVTNRSPCSDVSSQRPSMTDSRVAAGGSPTSGQRAEASLSKQLSKILDEGDLDDPGSLCLQFNRVVPPGRSLVEPPEGVHEPWGLPVAIEVLLETAITISGPNQITVLNVLDTYIDSANFEVRLETVLRQLENRFTKPSFGKAKTHYKAFGQLLGQLLVLSRLWNKLAADVTQKFVLHLVEKWAIFNRHGYQMGVQKEKTQSVFLECLEGFWDVAANTISDLDPSCFVRVQEWIHDKVLATTHPRGIRERCLQLLLKLGPVKLFNADDVKAPTCSVDIQTEISALHLPDAESSYQDGSSLFSQFDAEIEDTSAEADNPKHAAESSPVSHEYPPTQQDLHHHNTYVPKYPESRSVFQPFVRPEKYVNTSMSMDQKRFGPDPHSSRSQEVKNHPKRSPKSNSEDIDPLMSKFSSWAHCVSVGKKKPKKSDSKDLGGLKALALQTLNGEKYVFSGKFVKDLPPRFKKHLAPEPTEEVEKVVESDPHFYKKSSEERSAGLDYLTPRDSSEPIVYHDHHNDEASSQDSSPEKKDDEDGGQSIYTKLGLGNFPSVKDILNSSLSQTDSGSERGSRSVTPVNQAKGRFRSLTPIDKSEFSKRSSPSSQTGINRSHTPVQNVRTFSPVEISYSTESSNSDGRSSTSEPSVGTVNKPSITKYSRRGRGARSKRSSSRSAERSQNLTEKSQLNPNADEWSPVKGLGSPQLGSGVRGPPQGSASTSTAESSIKSIVEDIFGEGDGKNVPGHSSEISAVENMCGDRETEGDDGHNTSFCVSEIPSEVEDEKPDRNEGAETILPEYNQKSEYSGPLYDEDDYDDCDDDDGFFVSGFGDEVEKDFESQTVSSSRYYSDQSSFGGSRNYKNQASTGRFQSESSQKDVNWNTMDYSKPLDSSPQKPREPRYQWQPGRRKCTRCGSSDHTVYSCKKKTSMIF